MGREKTAKHRVLVIGGGLGGIRTALDLVAARREVVVVEAGHSIGGLMTLLDRTFPTNDCDLCTIAPELSDKALEGKLELLALSHVQEVTGEAGDFSVTVTIEPRYIDVEKCTGCGICLEAFPDCVKFEAALDHRAHSCMRYPKDIPQAFAVDLSLCEDVEALVACCPAKAIMPDDISRQKIIHCASIVLATGAQTFDPSYLDYLGYTEFPDVVTSLEYEKILSASGPSGGELLCPSNGRPPQKVAWIQCVGSRGVQKGAGAYCSHACCMFSLKEAILTKQRRAEVEATIFNMDIRTFGKDYEDHYNRAKNELGVRFLKSRPHSIIQTPGSEGLSLTYTSESSTRHRVEDFDMVVLATGFRPSPESKRLAGIMGIELGEHSFIQTDPMNSVATSRAGIYALGNCEAPKDIPETMVQASAAACMAARHSQPKDRGGQQVAPHNTGPREDAAMDFAQQQPRLGVFICDDDKSISEVVDLDVLYEETTLLPFVVKVDILSNRCPHTSFAEIKKTIIEQQLNRVVVAGYSPRTHLKKFQKLMEEVGLNKYLLEMANIREQASQVHSDHPLQATHKAKRLIQMAVSAVLAAQPLTDTTIPMDQRVLVVGGGVAGMTSALRLADQNFQVSLAEKSKQLGGLSKQIHRTLEGLFVESYVQELCTKVSQHHNIDCILDARIIDNSGALGNFTTTIQVAGEEPRKLEHGITVLATGATLATPPSSYPNTCAAVRTQFATQKYIQEHPHKVRAWGTVAMIQCVGSRTAENPGCSRVCCQTTVKNALAILEINPDAQVFVFYRDMRTYGMQEPYYQQAREKGVIFIRFRQDNPPQVTAVGDVVHVHYDDIILGKRVRLIVDSLCLSTGMVANSATNHSLAKIFNLSLTEDGYFQEEHGKFAPLDMASPGVFVAGTAHAPKLLRETIDQANGVAARAMTLLAQETVTLAAKVATVNSELCATCLICVRSCPYHIPFINAERSSQIDPARCHGCGSCVAACPAKAIQLEQFEDYKIVSQIDQLFTERGA